MLIYRSNFDRSTSIQASNLTFTLILFDPANNFQNIKTLQSRHLPYHTDPDARLRIFRANCQRRGDRERERERERENRLSAISLYAYQLRVSLRYGCTRLNPVGLVPAQARARGARAVGASERLDAARGRAGRFYTSETFPPRSFSWFARTRVMSPCLFDPLSRILMMVQMSRRTGAILSCEFRPDARPPTLGPRPLPPPLLLIAVDGRRPRDFRPLSLRVKNFFSVKISNFQDSI